MKNCLYSKLVGDSNNNNLDYLNGINVFVEGNTSIYCTNKQKAIIVGDGHFCSDGTYSDDQGKETTKTGSVYVATSSSCRVVIFNKYTITALTSEDNNKAYIDIDELKYSVDVTASATSSAKTKGDIASLANLTLLTRIKFSNSQVSGDVDMLPALPSITYFNLDSCAGIYGSLSSFSSRTALTTLNIYGTQITGDISTLGALVSLGTLKIPNAVNGTLESLIEAMWTNGRRSGTMNTFFKNGNVTIHGVKSKANENWNCTFANGGVTIVNSVSPSKTASYDGTSWTYQNI